MKARGLTNQDIDKLASRVGVKRIAIENFLGSMDTVMRAPGAHYRNCGLDARLYRWNSQTVKAIHDGISLAYS